MPTPVAAQSREVTRVSVLDSLLAIPVQAAARYAQAMSDAPAAVTVITAEEIAAFGFRTLDQVLARAAGFYTSNDRNYTYVGVRGFSRPTDYNNRLLLLLNGQPLNENTYGAAPLGTELGFDLSLLERIEIVRGPVSALYGNSAMFAVINLVTVEPVANAASVEVEAGSAGLVGGALRVQHVDSRQRTFVLGVQLSREHGEDLFYPEYAGDGNDGYAYDLDWTRFASFFGAAQRGNLRLQARASHRAKGIPTGSWESSFNHADARTEDSYAQFAAALERELRPGLTLSADAAVDYFRYRGWYPYELMWTDATDASRFTIGGRTIWDSSARNRVVAGVVLSRSPRADYRTWDNGVLESAKDRPFSTAGLYVQDEIFVQPWLSLILGGRIDAETGTSAHITPRTSMILRPTNETTLKLLYGEAFRSPNMYELTYNDQVRNYRIGHEHIRTYELIGEQRITSAATARVSLFHDEVTQLIDPVIDEQTGEYTFANVGSARTRGIESELTIGFGGWLLNSGGTWLTAQDPSSGAPLSNAPERVFRIGASGMALGSLQTAAQLRAESGRRTLAGNETAPSAVLDLSATYRVGSHLRIAASMTNALDQRYAHPAGLEHLQDVIPQDGRRLRLRFELRR